MGKYISIRSGASALPEQSIVHLDHDIINQSGVLDIANDHWEVSEHNPQEMSVDIAVGRGYFKKTTLTYHGYSDAVENVAVSANSSGNPRKDAVVAYIDLGVDLSAIPNADGSEDVLKFAVVAGTPASSPVVPTDNEIQTAIGAGNPFTRLANINVANGASSIVDANIADTRVPCYFELTSGLKDTEMVGSVSGGSKNKVQSITGNGTINLDLSLYNVFEITANGNITLSPINIPASNVIFFQVDIIQDATGNRTVTFFDNILWDDDVEPTETLTANKKDSFMFKKNNNATPTFNGYVLGQNMS